MRLTILGSGTNVHPTRAAAGYLVRTDHTFCWILAHARLMNLIKSGVNRHRITHILFSHFHADHFSDFITFFFDAVIYTKYGGGHRPGMTLIGPKGTIRLLQSIMRSFPSFSPAPFRVVFKEVSEQTLLDRGHSDHSQTRGPRSRSLVRRLSNRVSGESHGVLGRLAVLRCTRPALH